MPSKADYPPKHKWASSSQLKSVGQKDDLPGKRESFLQSAF